MEKITRTLTIQSYHICEVLPGETFSLKPFLPFSLEDSSSSQDSERLWSLQIPTENPLRYSDHSPIIKDIRIRIVPPDRRHIYVDSVMDIIPVSTKVLGKIGEGITRTLTGAYILLTGVDENGVPVCSFGNCDGMLDEKVVFQKAGTPGPSDILITFEVTLTAGAGASRSGPDAIHHSCDLFCQEIRTLMKSLSGRSFTEKHTYHDIIRPDKKKVVIVKLVSGQGAMYDTHFLAPEPSAYENSRSVIDYPGIPIVLSPNEYRDGAIRAMY